MLKLLILGGYIRLSYVREKKYYGRHSWTNINREGDLVQMYRVILPPPLKQRSFRVVEVLSPANCLVHNAQLCNPIKVHHRSDEVYMLTEKEEPPDRIAKGNLRG